MDFNLEKPLPHKYKLSFPDSMKILEEAIKKDRAIQELSHYSGMLEDEAVKAVNKLLYDAACERNISLYTLCFHTIPEFGHVDITDTGFGIKAEQTIRLAPVEFDLEHDGGYWKDKYFKLKNKLQELIDNKEE